EDPRAISRLLKAGAPHGSVNALVHGLQLLEQLDTRSALQTFRGPQLHLFAGLDAFVPAEAASDLLALLPDVEVGLIEQASHAFLLENPHGVAAAIHAFLHESGDD
ncbi:MAG: transporter, partial [Pseudomonas caspiana]